MRISSVKLVPWLPLNLHFCKIINANNNLQKIIRIHNQMRFTCNNERDIMKLVSELRLCVLTAAPSERSDGELVPITEPALLTRCAWESHAINCTALLVYNLMSTVQYMLYTVLYILKTMQYMLYTVPYCMLCQT